jgi:hypothetical protein
MEFADGAIYFAAFLVIAFIGVVIGYFTQSGGITARAYGKMYSGAPGARTRGEVSGHDPQMRPVREWSRGTR